MFCPHLQHVQRSLVPHALQCKSLIESVVVQAACCAVPWVGLCSHTTCDKCTACLGLVARETVWCCDAIRFLWSVLHSLLMLQSAMKCAADATWPVKCFGG
jgi:hypothetical protein